MSRVVEVVVACGVRLFGQKHRACPTTMRNMWIIEKKNHHFGRKSADFAVNRYVRKASRAGKATQLSKLSHGRYFQSDSLCTAPNLSAYVSAVCCCWYEYVAYTPSLHFLIQLLWRSWDTWKKVSNYFQSVVDENVTHVQQKRSDREIK